jgi:polyhydroxyalkanoate synthase
MQDPENGQDLLQGLMTGIRKYQLHPYERTLPALPVVWQSGEVILLLAKAGGKNDQPPLLLIPSMINGSSILDLMEERSLARWMAGQGRDVYLLDWGTSIKDDEQASVDRVLRERLIPAIAFAAQESGGPVDVLGYCMAGTLLAAAAQIAPELIRKAVFLATPWDFHAGDKKLQAMVQYWSAGGLALMAQHGILPADWVQSVFASVDPHQSVNKFTNFIDVPDDDPRARRFVAVEDWLNEAADLPREIAQTCIQAWYLDNLPGRGRWKVEGEIIEPSILRGPSLVVVASKDRLVPPQSSAALHTAIPGATWVESPTGHIGLIAGEKAIEDTWSPIDLWLRQSI